MERVKANIEWRMSEVFQEDATKAGADFGGR
jgi:hypothetical protein